jgi:NADH-quinone oxidoreductase subunit G
MSAVALDKSPETVTIELDGQVLIAPKGSMIIESADKAGIAIPRFCYHRKLAIAATCRMCMVEGELGGKPMPKPQPACATPVADGMKIFTQSRRALSAQRNVMEFLLINHPLDCPICDQGGECELQDLSLGYGRSVSRFVERKRVVPDENLGPLVATEMTRCIQCTRCIRVMGEIAGTYELGGMGRTENLEIGTWVGKPLMSEISGNVIDVCPVGALTDKVFRFRARAWELLARESVGYHDALGSNLWLHTRRGEVLRAVPRDNEAINECWLSDRDRYSHQGLAAPDRATMPQIKCDGAWVECDWEEGIHAAAEALRSVPRGDLGALVQPATSNDEGHLLARLVRGRGSENIDHRLRQLDFVDAHSAAPFAMPVAEVENADVVVLVGCNPRHEIPLLHARLRKAQLAGTRIYAINPLDFAFAFDLAGKCIVAPDMLVDALLGLARAANDKGHEPESKGLAGELADATADPFAAEVVDALLGARRGVLLVGETAIQHAQASWLRMALKFIAQATGSAYDEIPQGANAVGLAATGVLPGAGGLDAGAMLARPRKGYVLYGCEPPYDFADGAAAHRALQDADVVVAFSAFASEELREVADLILPIGLLPEIDATMVNLDGTAQQVAAGVKPPGHARAGWRVLRALGAELGLDGFDFIELAELRARMRESTERGSASAAPDSASARLTVRNLSLLGELTRGRHAEHRPPGSFLRIATTPIYRGDAVLRRAAALNAHPLTRGACVGLHPDDAGMLGVVSGGTVRIGAVILPVAVDAGVPRGTAWIETGYPETASLPPHGANLELTVA